MYMCREREKREKRENKLLTHKLFRKFLTCKLTYSFDINTKHVIFYHKNGKDGCGR